MTDRLKIGQEVLVHGYVDEIRKDTIIIQNEGGYFGTVECEVTDIDVPDTDAVLDKIRAEIENMEIVYDKSPNYEDDRTDEEKAIDWFNMHKFLFLQIIDKYKGESEG